MSMIFYEEVKYTLPIDEVDNKAIKIYILFEYTFFLRPIVLGIF